MKRLVLLALLLVPLTVYSLARMDEGGGAARVISPSPPVMVVPPAPVAPLPPTPPALPTPPEPPTPPDLGELPDVAFQVPPGEAHPPWFRPPGGDEDSVRFRQGSEPPRVVVIHPNPPHRFTVRQVHPEPRPVDPSAGLTAVAGDPMTSRERARQNARAHLDRAVTRWLAESLPARWKPPAALVDALVVEGRTEYVVVPKDYATLYQAVLHCDLSPGRLESFVRAYQDELAQRRLNALGIILAFVLTCLAALAGYIRADEATKGYYTNRLRAIAAATVGAAGAVAYKLLS